MDNLTTSVYTYLGNTIILEDGHDWWVLHVYHVNDQDRTADIALKRVNVRYVTAPLGLGARVGEMSRANCVSLVQLADMGAHRFRTNLTWNNPAGIVVVSLSTQGIIERIHVGALPSDI